NSLFRFLARVETGYPQTVTRFFVSWLGLKQAIPRLFQSTRPLLAFSFSSSLKSSPYCYCAFRISRAQAKKTRQGLNLPSNFRAHEKTVHTVIALFTFPERKKKSLHRAIAPCQFLGRKLK
ncbi:TPA: hypothetical protein ACGOWH_001721, partial [Streptococcus suis]